MSDRGKKEAKPGEQLAPQLWHSSNELCITAKDGDYHDKYLFVIRLMISILKAYHGGPDSRADIAKI